MDIVNIIGTVILGALAGYLASVIVGTNQQQGCLADIVVGVIGAFIGRFIIVLFPGGRLLGGILDTIIFATLGAIVLLIILQLIVPGRGRRRRRSRS